MIQLFETEAREITKLGKEIQKIIPGRIKVTWIKYDQKKRGYLEGCKLKKGS